MWFEVDVRVKDVGSLILLHGGTTKFRFGGVVMHHPFHMGVDLAIPGVTVLDIVGSFVDFSYLMLDPWAAVNQQLIGSLEELTLATFLGEADDFEEFLQFDDSEFCQVSLQGGIRISNYSGLPPPAGPVKVS